MIAFAMALRLTSGDEKIWNVMQHMFIDEGLEDIGLTKLGGPFLNLKTKRFDPDLLIKTLEVYRITVNLYRFYFSLVIEKKYLKNILLKG